MGEMSLPASGREFTALPPMPRYGPTAVRRSWGILTASIASYDFLLW